MRSPSSMLVMLSLLASSGSTAQLSFGGHPYGMDRSLGLPQAPTSTMPTVDEVALKAEDELAMAGGKKGPYRFGFNHAVDIALDNAGVWHTLSNGDRVWRATIVCPGALSINMEFDRFEVPDGAKVFVYNDLGDVLGGFEAGSNPGHTELGVDLLAGERVTVEYVEPERVSGQGRLRIGQVTHGYRDVFGITRGFNESGSCNNNVICPLGDPWRDQIRSVAIMLTGGSGFCTGQFVNNCNNDGTPYFLTANHCMEGAGSNIIFRFNWQSPNCTPNTNGPTGQSMAGYTTLYRSAGSDVALLRLNGTVPTAYNVFYSGWNAGAAAPTGAVTAIHHPAGDVKKISFENQSVSSEFWDGAQCWRVNDWDNGTTEGGSSGSGLWNQNGLLVGQLFGGYARCGNNLQDYYGKFSVSYPLLQTWLGDCGPTLQGYPSVTTGIDDTPSASGALLVWPNPGQGTFTVELPMGASNGHMIRVIDAVGRVVTERDVRTGADRRVQLDLEGVPGGVYMVEALSGNARSQQRLIISH